MGKFKTDGAPDNFFSVRVGDKLKHRFGIYVEESTGLLYFLEQYYPDSGNVSLRGMFTPPHMNPHVVAGQLKIVSDHEFDLNFKELLVGDAVINTLDGGNAWEKALNLLIKTMGLKLNIKLCELCPNWNRSEKECKEQLNKLAKDDACIFTISNHYLTVAREETE